MRVLFTSKLPTTPRINASGRVDKNHGKIETIRPKLNLFAVQMVSQSQFFRGFYLLCLMRLSFLQKNMRNFK